MHSNVPHPYVMVVVVAAVAAAHWQPLSARQLKLG
jgi:hypothetical protein